MSAFAAVSLLASSQPLAAQAQHIDDAVPIIVTAQRRPERPEDVPISLSVKSVEELKRSQATDTPDLDKVVPSLVMMRTGAFTQPYIRGIGKRSTLGVENSVATYVDGVYLASPVNALLDLRAIDRIEVLNGPQGTLFGRNATGGVIQIVTRDPSVDSSVEAEVHAGSDHYLRGDLYLTGGTDRISGNLALSLSKQGGYGSNLVSRKTDQGKIDHSIAARSKWVVNLSSTTRLTVAGDYQDLDHDFRQLPATGFQPIGQPRIQTLRDGDQDTPSSYRFRYGGLSAKIDVNLGALRFMSLSALRRMHETNSVDLDMGPTQLISAAVSADQNQFSQEFQIQSAEPSRVRLTGGLYYLHVLERYDPTTFSFGGSYSASLGGRTGQILFSRGTTSSYAAYGQGAVNIDEATQVTLGLRYTLEQRTVRANGQRIFDNPPEVRAIPGLPLIAEEPFRSSKKFHELTWRGSLDRHFSDEMMGYVSASRGFQSGGWNLQTPQNAAFGPERLDDFEAGLKFSDRAQRLSASAGLFYYDYRDIQVSAITPAGNVTVNAASARSYGLELELDARFPQGTSINIGAQLLKTRFGEFPNATCTNYSPSAFAPYAPFACDVTGNSLPFAPTVRFNAGASHTMSLGRAGSLVLSGNLSHSSRYFSEPDNVVRQGAYTTVDSLAEWQPRPSGPSVQLWVRNLTNARYYDSLVTFPTAGVLQRPAAPRQIGVTLAQRF